MSVLRRAFRGSISLLRMPSLSPSMTSGVVTRLHGAEKPGDMVQKYGLFADILAHGLYNVEKEKPVLMELELQDELYLAKMFIEPHVSVAVDAPVALFVEEQEDVELAAALTQVEVLQLADQAGGNASTQTSPTKPRILPVLWQAYLKSSKDEIKCSNS